MGNPENPEIQKENLRKNPKYIKGKETALSFYDDHFDVKTVPTNEFLKFNKSYHEALDSITKKLEKAGDKNAKRKRTLMNLQVRIQAINATLRKQIKSTIEVYKQSFVEEGAIAHTLTEKHAVRSYFGTQLDKNVALRTQKTEAGEIQREYDLEVKKQVSKSLKELKALKGEVDKA